MDEKGEANTVEHVSTPHGDTVGSAAPKEKVTRTVLFFSAFIAISAAIGNFDNNYGGTVLLMTPFNTAFGPCQDVPGPTGALIKVCRITALQQSLVSLTSLFNGVGCLLSSVTGTYFGRRGTIQVGALLVLVGASGMLATNSSYLNYMVCKCIGGVGLGFLFNGTIVYGVECTPPHRRGMLLGLFSIGLGAGSALAAGVCAGSSGIPNNWAWKTPIACQIPLSVTLGTGIMLFPESPRWLLLRNKEDKARSALGRFMHQDPASDAVRAQIAEIQTYLEFERVTAATSSWVEMFHRRNIRRTLISILLLVVPALGGTFFIVPYTAVFLGGLGISNPFLITAIVNLCIFAGSLFSSFPVEYIGRRLTLILGLSIQATCMLIFSAVSSGLGTHARVTQNTLIVFLCLWCFTFASSTSPAIWVGSAEMHSVRLRTYGQAVALCVNSVFAFSAQFWTPYMINPGAGNMGTNVGYFYFGLTIVLLMLTLVFVPETARLKLEQIDDYFESGVPAWKTSIGRTKEIAERNILEVNTNVKLHDTEQPHRNVE
jgi:MFS transporter, SP family, sugar:H+ symporter